MGLADRLRGALLRWNRLGLALVLALPLAASSVLGFVWLYERGWLLWFALASAALYAAVRGGLAVARWRAAGQGGVEPRSLPGPSPEPEWSAAEVAAFERAQGRIAVRLQQPIPWADLPAEALAVVEAVAADMSNGQRSALDFTLPEALLLIDRVALQYRAFLLANVPWSDRLSVRTMHWLWRKQDAALTAWETGFLAWRGVRLVMNPAVGLLREAERVLALGLQDRLTERFRRDAQAILLEEAAQAAVDLYSGRLKTSDAELARVAARTEARDLSLAPPAEGAVRIVVVGQKGVGKSVLVDALTGAEAAAGDPTESAQSHAWEIDGAEIRLIDMPGSDGGARATRALAERMAGADVVIWVHRANRPGRAPDLALAEAFRAALDPTHRAPPVIHVATGADLLIPGWPRPENALTKADRDRLDAAMRAIAEALPGTAAIPVRAEAPAWNIAAVSAAIRAALPEGRLVRRAHLRAEAGKDAGLGGNLKRAGRGIGTAARTLWGRLRG
ncbi:MAG: 50S ribosome-binding GTPase [Rhodobacter sp.]|nr:50S ribosome-binding GTPase [Paracoccaceae bacterium]MCC0077426.1 50S ribosome-binding GTPase [Rhodobacter sp.]